MNDPVLHRPAAWPEGAPSHAWHSFDTTPWLHPWLTSRNLRAMREMSAVWREEARRVVERADRLPTRFGFIGNMANGMYTRAKAVARSCAHVDVFVLAGDRSIFADPRWEEYGGALPENSSYLDGENTFLEGVQTAVPFRRLTQTIPWPGMTADELPPYVRPSDFQRWPEYFCDLPALDEMQSYDCLLAAQRPHIAYLSGRPYAATPTGGDWWLEASRDDAFGRLQRTSWGRAGCLCVGNPWNYSHARRYGFNNLLHLPLAISEIDYSPGHPIKREQWKAESGGEFFVFSSARADDYYKGSNIGLRGFAEFARNHPEARLIFTSWGNDFDKIKQTIFDLGLVDRVVLVPLSGKRQLVEYLRSADCLLDQFKIGYYGATALEAAACGLPVIIRLETAQYVEFCEASAPPFLNAATVSQVADALEVLAADPARRIRYAAEHRDWFLKNQSGERWAADYEAVLGALALGHKFSFEKSPLTEELSPAERLYHAEQLEMAPAFPDYEHAPFEIGESARLLEKVREKQRDVDELSGQIEVAVEVLAQEKVAGRSQLLAVEKQRLAAENKVFAIGQKLNATEQKLTERGDQLSATQHQLTITANRLIIAENKVNDIENKLTMTANRLAATQDELNLTASMRDTLATSLDTSQQERDFLRSKLDSILFSSSWRLMKPLRAIGDWIRRTRTPRPECSPRQR